MSALAEFNQAFTAGWNGDPLDRSESAVVKAAHRAGKQARADHDYHGQKRSTE